VPASCPTGFAAQGEVCEPAACDAGQQRMSDGVTCCWPGQALVAGACRGVPSSCPVGAEAQGESCVARPGTTLRVELAGQDHDLRLDVAVETARGTLRCPQPVTYVQPCELRAVPAGSTRLRVDGGMSFTRDGAIPAGELQATLQLGVRRFRNFNGIEFGLLGVGTIVGGVVGIELACSHGSSSSSSDIDPVNCNLGFGLLIGGIGVPLLGLGIVMLALPDVPVATLDAQPFGGEPRGPGWGHRERARRGVPRLLGAGVGPLAAGGGVVTTAIAF
jgi:hypothetical protein